MRLKFDWDPQKAKSNARKHGIPFPLAASVFRDPRALSEYDADHSETEERWITVGICSTGQLIAVMHTYIPVDEKEIFVRIISARKATKGEEKTYVG